MKTTVKQRVLRLNKYAIENGLNGNVRFAVYYQKQREVFSKGQGYYLDTGEKIIGLGNSMKVALETLHSLIRKDSE